MKRKVQPDIQKALKPFRFRLRLTNAALGGCWGMLAAAAACALIAAASYFIPIAKAALYMVWAAAGALALFVLLGFLKPVSIQRAARAADKAGLSERAVTALDLAGDSPMAAIQREDALKHLKALPPKAALPMRVSPRPLLAAGGLGFVLAAALLFIQNPQYAVLNRQNAFQKAMAPKAQTVDKAAEELEKAPYTKEQVNELRKMMGDLALQLREAREPQQAYLAMDKAQRNLEEFSRNASNASRQAAAQALEQNGMKDMAEALKNGDAQAAAQAAAQLGQDGASAQALAKAAEAMPEGALKEAAQAAAQALQSGSAASIQAALSSLSSAAQGTASGTLTGDLSALLSQLRAGAQAASASQSGAGQGQGQGQGSGGQGNGGQGGQGQGAGSGAGKGSTNQDAGVGKGQQSSGGQGAGAPEYKLGQYETIYDPTRLNVGDETHQAAGQMGEGESQQVQLDPGLGDAFGQVPYHQVIYTYQEAASKAAEQALLPEAILKWVDGYFQSLID